VEALRSSVCVLGKSAADTDTDGLVAGEEGHDLVLGEFLGLDERNSLLITEEDNVTRRGVAGLGEVRHVVSKVHTELAAGLALVGLAHKHDKLGLAVVFENSVVLTGNVDGEVTISHS